MHGPLSLLKGCTKQDNACFRRRSDILIFHIIALGFKFLRPHAVQGVMPCTQVPCAHTNTMRMMR